MRKLYRSRCNVHCHLFQVRRLFLSTYSVSNPSYSFSETDALARCSLGVGDLSTHVCKEEGTSSSSIVKSNGNQEILIASFYF